MLKSPGQWPLISDNNLSAHKGTLTSLPLSGKTQMS